MGTFETLVRLHFSLDTNVIFAFKQLQIYSMFSAALTALLYSILMCSLVQEDDTLLLNLFTPA